MSFSRNWRTSLQGNENVVTIVKPNQTQEEISNYYYFDTLLRRFSMSDSVKKPRDKMNEDPVRAIKNGDSNTKKVGKKNESIAKKQHQERRSMTKKRKVNMFIEEEPVTVEENLLMVRRLRNEMNDLKNDLDDKKDEILELQAMVQGLKEEKEDILKMYWHLIIDTYVSN